MAGEEVTITYGSGYWKSVPFNCRCFSTGCMKPSPLPWLGPNKKRRTKAEKAVRALRLKKIKEMEKAQIVKATRIREEYEQCLRRQAEIRAGKSADEVMVVALFDSEWDDKERVLIPTSQRCPSPMKPFTDDVVTIE